MAERGLPVPGNRVLVNTHSSHDETQFSGDAGESSDVRARLRAASTSVRGAVLLRVHGEIDAYTLGRWRRLFAAARTEAGRSGHLVIDVDNATFMSCRAIIELAEDAQRYRRGGGRVSIVSSGPSPIPRIITLAGLAQWLPVHPDTDSATADRLLSRHAPRTGPGSSHAAGLPRIPG